MQLSLPDFRRSRLKRVLEYKGLVTAMEAHSGLTGLLVEKTKVEEKPDYTIFIVGCASKLFINLTSNNIIIANNEEKISESFYASLPNAFCIKPNNVVNGGQG